MIQRIQTIFLFLAFVCMACMFVFPLASFVDVNGHVYQLSYNSIYSIDKTQQFNQSLNLFNYLIIIIISAIVVSIFLFRKRPLQMRICTMIVILSIFLQGIIVFYFFQFKNTLGGTGAPAIAFILPLINAILVYLAFRGILKDEILVKSLNRLR